MKANNLVQVDAEVDLSYFKKILDDTKKRLDELSFIEQRASMVTHETSLEDEITIVYDEIKKNEKELKNLLTVSEFLFENSEELQNKLESEQQTIEDMKREIFGYKHKNEAIMEELEQKTQVLDRLQQGMQSLEKQLNEQREENSQLKLKYDNNSKQLEQLSEKLIQENDKSQQSDEQFQLEKREHENKLQELETRIQEFIVNLEKQTQSSDEKDLEISRIRRENEDLLKQKKNQSEKILEYQSTNERLRKDKTQMEESLQQLQNKLSMQEQLAKSAAMVLGNQDLDQDQNDNDNNAGLGGELNELEDMDGSFNGNTNDQSRNNSYYEKNRRGTFQVDLNESMGSQNNDFQKQIFELQEQYNAQQQTSVGTEQKLMTFNDAPKPVMVEQETETEYHNVTEKKIQTESVSIASTSIQTEKLETKQISMQTFSVEFKEQDIQTDVVEDKVDCVVLSQVFQMEIMPPFVEVQQQKISPVKRNSKFKPKIGLEITTGNECLTEGNEEVQSQKIIPSTVKAAKSKQFEINTDIEQLKTEPSIKTPSSSKNSFRDFLANEYFINRDPLKEFFALTCQSVKLNSPHMNIICTINQNTLYEKALLENIPFFKWYSWIDSTINKEVLQSIFKDKMKGSPKKKTESTAIAAKKPAEVGGAKKQTDSLKIQPQPLKKQAAGASTSNAKPLSGTKSVGKFF